MEVSDWLELKVRLLKMRLGTDPEDVARIDRLCVLITEQIKECEGQRG